MRAIHSFGLSLAVASLVLAGCSSDPEPGTAVVAASTPTPTPEPAPAAPPTWPLTGLPAAKGAERKHPVVVTKIDNSNAEPQAGLDHADLVVEELVEGGLTRLAAFFYSDLPTQVGPVRSMRDSDIGIVKPTGGVITTSGAAPGVISAIEGAGLKFFAEGAAGFSRDSGRRPPYNLMADLTAIAAETKQPPARPADYLPWGPAADFPGGRPATSIDASFGGAHSTEWEYAAGKYTRTNTLTPKDADFVPDSVLVLSVRTSVADYLDPAGNPVPETHFVGTGPAHLFHAGQLVRGTWSKPSLGKPLTLAAAGAPLTVPAGKVWIELVPSDSGGVTFTK